MSSPVTWNPQRQLWETEQADLFSGQQEPYSETWPSEGMTRNGQLLPLPASGHPIEENESLLLPTPQSNSVRKGRGAMVVNRQWSAPGLEQVLEMVQGILPREFNSWDEVPGVSRTMHPTPRATDGTKGGPNQRGSSGDLMLPSAVMEMPLLPSPVAQQSGNPPEVHLRKKPGRSQVTDLAIVVENGLLATGGRLADAGADESTMTGALTLDGLMTAGADDAGVKDSGPTPSAVMEM